MNEKYTFILDALTIGDYVTILSAAKDNDMVSLLAVVDRCLVGGLYDRPFDEMTDIMAAFARAGAARFAAAPKADESAIARLIRQATGE